MPTWNSPNSDISQFCGTIDGPSVLPGSPYNTSPQDNTAAFTRQFQASSYKTLRDLVMAHASTCGACGITNPNGTPRDINAAGIVKWGHGSEGFVASHEGPCEIWCDATRVFHKDNCARNVGNGVLTIDVAKCKGARHLVAYWLALHVPTWQIYLNCVALGGEGGASQNTSNPLGTTPSPRSTPFFPPEYTHQVMPGYGSPPNYQPPAPVPGPTTPTPTPPPNNSPPSALPAMPSIVVAAWGQCGGKLHQGPTQCVHGHVCHKLSNAYSQCVPQENNPGELRTWAQCGGKAYLGSTKCKSSDACTAKSEYYSQCLPK